MSDDKQVLAARVAATLAMTTDLERLNTRLILLAEHMTIMTVLDGDRDGLARWRTSLDALHRTQAHMTAIREALACGNYAETRRQVTLAQDSHHEAMEYVRAAGPDADATTA